MSTGSLPGDLALRLYGDTHLAIHAQLTPAAPQPAVSPLVPGLSYGLTAGGQPVTHAQLDAWGVSFDQAVATVAAAAPATPEPTWQGDVAVIRDPQFAVLVWLEPDRARAWREPPPRKLFGKKRPTIPDPPVVLTPTADTTLIGPATPVTYQAALQFVQSLLGQGTTVVTLTPYRLDVTGWSPFDGFRTGDVGVLAEQVACQFRAALYEYQKPLLQAQFEDEDGVFVASAKVFRGPGGEVFSTSVWSEEVATLLPETDVVSLVPAGATRPSDAVVVAWSRLAELAPGWSKPEGLTPERHRTLAFPDAALRDRLHVGPRDKAADQAADEATPSPVEGLSPADYEWLVQAATEVLARHGHQVVRRQRDSLVTDQNLTLGLLNLGLGLVQRPRDQWQEAVEAQVTAMATAPPDLPAGLEELRAAILPRLWHESALVFPKPSWAKPAGVGLWYLAAIDRPDRVESLVNESDLGQYGGWEPLWDAALANLRALGEVEHLFLDATDEALGLHLFTSADFFVATRLALVDELLATAGAADAGLGLFIGLPVRNGLMAHVVTKESFSQPLNRMAARIRHLHTTQPGGVSPWLYYRRDATSELVPLAQATEGDLGRIQVVGEVMDPLLARLGEAV